MKYLIVQEWANTKGNHAGMKHMCDLLAQKYPCEYMVITKPSPLRIEPKGSFLICRIMHRLKQWKYKRAFKKEYMRLCQPMFDNLKTGDIVFLLEYHLLHVSQLGIASFVKKHYPDVKVCALSHLTPKYFRENPQLACQFADWNKFVDVQLTLGSSLTEYFISTSCFKEISTGFHYVDNEYYHKDISDIKPVDKITVITMGNLQRDWLMLSKIVAKCHNVNWLICCGYKKVQNLFPTSKNIKLLGYLEEEELKHYMEISDVSLNVMEDTVGSNVITTSLAMGLAIVASDVGSIRDYCDESNSILCENTVPAFVNAINELSISIEKVVDMRRQSLKKSRQLSIARVNEWFNSI